MTCEKMLRPKPRPDDRPPFRSPFSHYLNPLGGVTANSPWLYIYGMCVCVVDGRQEVVLGVVCKICKDATSTALSVKFLYKLQPCVDADVDAT